MASEAATALVEIAAEFLKLALPFFGVNLDKLTKVQQWICVLGCAIVLFSAMLSGIWMFG